MEAISVAFSNLTLAGSVWTFIGFICGCVMGGVFLYAVTR